jgi:ribonuclease HII
MVKVPHTTLERNLLSQGYESVIGVDEVGMACLAGPVVVCALAVGSEFYRRRHAKLAGLRDSKTLLAHQRERYAESLAHEPGLRWEIGLCDVGVIDDINIYQASRRAMRDALHALGTHTDGGIVLVDGNKPIHGIALPQQAIVAGDRKIWAIAAASVLAKVFRDRLMTEYAREYPAYGFERHKGYPTALHRVRIAEHGLCPLHRRSFRSSLDALPLES